MSNTTNQERLDAVIAKVRKAVPTADSIHLETSDQNYYGFNLIDVSDGDDDLSTSDPELLSQLQDDTDDDLGNIDRNGVVGESREGYAVVTIEKTDTDLNEARNP